MQTKRQHKAVFCHEIRLRNESEVLAYIPVVSLLLCKGSLVGNGKHGESWFSYMVPRPTLRQPWSMDLLSEGCLEHDAHLWSKNGNWISSMHLFTPKKDVKVELFTF